MGPNLKLNRNPFTVRKYETLIAHEILEFENLNR